MALPRRQFLAGLTLAFLAAGALPVLAQQTFSQEKLIITDKHSRQHGFTVDLALTGAQSQQGLMFVKSMPADRGMLFDFQTNRNVQMWMRNTFIPLDMLFISQSGTVTHVHENAVPHDESIISSRGPVRFVLELNAGTVKALGIGIGDTVTSNQIKKAAK